MTFNESKQLIQKLLRKSIRGYSREVERNA